MGPRRCGISDFLRDHVATRVQEERLAHRVRKVSLLARSIHNVARVSLMAREGHSRGACIHADKQDLRNRSHPMPKDVSNRL